VKLNGASGTATELALRLVGAALLNSDALHDLPAAFNPRCIDDNEVRTVFETLERLSRAKRLPIGRVDHALVISEGNLGDGTRQTLLLAETYADDILLRGTTIRDHAQALLDRRRRLELRDSLQRAQEEIHQGGDLDEIISHLTSQLLGVTATEPPEVISYKDAALETMEAIEHVQKGRARVLRTGFERIDSILRIRPGNLIIVGARSKVGKTTWARQVADTVAMRRQHVAFHSLEMSVPEVVALDLSRALSIDSTEFFDDGRRFTGEQWARIQEEAMRRAPAGTDGFLHANHYRFTLGEICRITEKLHRKHGLALVVIDYLQLVQLELGKNATREQVVATISRTLKLLAQRLGVPIIACAQLNRDAAKRGERPWRPRKKKAKAKKQDPMALQGQLGAPPPAPEEPEQPETPPEDEPAPPPQLHDLRESGAIEQDANAVCFIHHPFDGATDADKREHGPFSFIVAAQRLGPKGTVKLYAERNYSRFIEVD
jgi:replicative DNA helicase